MSNMNIASLELCKELYELSGWGCDGFYYWNGKLEDDHKVFGRQPASSFPAYDLGNLLRKLPRYQVFEGEDCRLAISSTGFNYNRSVAWYASYENDEDEPIELETADTPEDAAVKLAIVLFMQGILKRETGDGA
jgi:hypothetical protein